MNIAGTTGKWCSLRQVLTWLLSAAFFLPGLVSAQEKVGPPAFTNPPIVLTVEGTNVFIQRFRSNLWESAYANQILAAKDRGRTGIRSRTSVRLSDLSVLRIGERSEFEIQPLPDPKVEAEFSLFRGLLYLLNRDRPGKHRFITPTATAATRGTEFTLEVEEATGRTVLTVLEGEAELGNAAGTIRIASGEQGVALLGQMPTKTAAINTTNVVQWCLYYPGVLNLAELNLAPNIEAGIRDSLEAYRSGDLLRAVAAYPADRTPASDDEKVYLAALLLSVGQVTQAEALLDSFAVPGKLTTSRSHSLASALRMVIETVNRRTSLAPEPSGLSPLLATELLALSYSEQSRSQLDEALHFARLSVKTSPQFAFGWTRVAELEFSEGRTRRALEALEKSLALAPRNGQALALKGFLLSAQNQLREATGFFEQALAIDGGLGNAWLGRGLCRIREGRAAEGRFDLHVAATTEPQRSLLRSYLGKAFSNDGDPRHAEKELRLAQELDAGDPTPWLYSALLLQQQNRINEGVLDLQRSQELNENRAIYRGRLMLDQDRAVRGANLANLYRDAGMTDVSAREAGRAVSADYANYSSHLFLANSFNELRDPNRVNLRYETAWFSEYLVANLLAPVGAGTLSQTVSQQEYSKLFERDRFGIASSTEYLSHGEWRQNAAQFGTVKNTSYAVELSYHSDDGWRPNNDVEELGLSVELKHQITAKDGVYFRVGYYDLETGDPNQYYLQSDANPGLRTHERQEPMLLGGYHREWSPGNHTLILAGRLQDSYDVDDPSQQSLLFYRPFGPLGFVAPLYYDQTYRSDTEIYTAEAQQIRQWGEHTTIVGGRFQAGEFGTRNTQTGGQFYTGSNLVAVPFTVSQSEQPEFRRESIYLYDHWQIWPTLLVAGGFSYDWMKYPQNHRLAPVSGDEENVEQLSPKGGLVWTPAKDTVVRAGYFAGLGGVSLDQSVRLEPSQIAGFNQAYRSIMPESVAGANSAASFDGWAMSLEQKLGRSTFFAVSGEILSSEVNRQVGVVEFYIPPVPTPTPFSATQTREELDFRERTLTVTLNQLLSDEWSLGARYRLSKAELETRFPQIPATTAAVGGFSPSTDEEAVLHQLHLSAFYNHASGFFGGAGAVWNLQSNQGYSPDRPGDNFWQFNVEAGWRFFRRRLEARVALLNLTDQDYRLNPLNLTTELPREREVAFSLRFNF